jgi:hypothetical protein
VDGEADGRPGDAPGEVPSDDPGRERLVGRPVVGSTGEVVPNGCVDRKGDGVPVGDCDGSVEGEDDGGCTCGVVVPVCASAGAAASARITSTKSARDITTFS